MTSTILQQQCALNEEPSMNQGKLQAVTNILHTYQILHRYLHTLCLTNQCNTSLLMRRSKPLMSDFTY